jgi:hypothetical protein
MPRISQNRPDTPLNPGTEEAPGDRRESRRQFVPALHARADVFSGGLILFMVLFSPWAFGTTEPWSIRIMNGLACALGGLLLVKWVLRFGRSWHPPRWNDRDLRVLFLSRLLAALTLFILAYCLTSAWNARASYSAAAWSFEFRDHVPWLPHSYDARGTWALFWNYTALAIFFWAARDWLLGKSAGDLAGEEGARKLLPGRLRLLLWVLSVNGALVALQGILQQIEGGGKLLWLVKPLVNPAAETQFGPYAYRANASQFFNLIWPVTLGFWWTLRQTQHRQRERGVANLLLPCALLMAAAPLISNSRGGALVTAASMVIAFAIFILGERRVALRTRAGLFTFFVLVFGLGWLAGWPALSKRMEQLGDAFILREEMFDRGRQIAEEYRWFGTGPGTLDPVFQLYRESPEEYWPAQLHNDWLETRITFGRLGTVMILLAFLTVIARWFLPGGIAAPRVLTWLTWLALAGCLAHARFDFPFQIYSILLVFLLLCSMLFCMSRRT